MSVRPIPFNGVHPWKGFCLAPVFLCVHVGVQVRRLQGLCDPEMSSGSQEGLLLIGQSSFYALICEQGGSIWRLLVLGLCAGASGPAILDISQGAGAP